MSKCPNCGVPLRIDSDVADDSRFCFKIFPKEDALLNAKTVGGVISEVRELIRASAEDHEKNVEVMVEKMETDDDGTMTIHFLVTKEREAKRDD